MRYKYHFQEHTDRIRSRISLLGEVASMSSGGCHLVTENHGLNYIPRMDRTWNFGLYCRFLLPLLRRDREGSHGN